MILSKKSFIILIITCFAFVAYRCAQIIPLNGGTKDTKAPELISVVPANKSMNVSTRTKIVFKFNEMISAPTASQKLIVNPRTDEMPDITVRGKILTIEFAKPLQANTTYLLQFANSIVDIHENNALTDFTYMFSTGPTIDSSFITGKVSDAFWKEPMADVSIMLYISLSDTAPLRSKPDYLTKVGAEGKYFLSAVKPGTYQAIALVDKNKNLMYDAGEAVGFLNAPVSIDNDTLNFELSVSKTENVFVKKKNQVFWGFNRYILSDTLPDAYIIHAKNVNDGDISFETRNDTLEVYYKNLYDQNMEFLLKKEKLVFDTISLNLPSKTKTDSTIDKISTKINFHAEKATYGVKYDDVILNFSLPIESINAEKCFLIKDTTKEKPVFSPEKRNETKTLVTTYYPQYKRALTNNLLPASTYTLMCLPRSIETFWGTFNKDTVKTVFKTFPTDEIGNLQLKLVLNDSISAFVLQLLNANNKVVNEFIGVRKDELMINFYNLLPGDYALRLIKDGDENKKFSPSNFLKHAQAEPVWYYEKPVKILAGWDIEASWNMKTEKIK